MTEKSSPLVVNAEQLAKLLGVSKRHICRMDASGKLPAAVRLGWAKRWSLDSIRQWVDAGSPGRDEWEAMQDASRKEVRYAY